MGVPVVRWSVHNRFTTRHGSAVAPANHSTLIQNTKSRGQVEMGGSCQHSTAQSPWIRQYAGEMHPG